MRVTECLLQLSNLLLCLDHFVLHVVDLLDVVAGDLGLLLPLDALLLVLSHLVAVEIEGLVHGHGLGGRCGHAGGQLR